MNENIIKRNVMIAKAGGHSSKNCKTYRINLPVSVIKALGITEDDKGVLIEIKEKSVVITKDKSSL